MATNKKQTTREYNRSPKLIKERRKALGACYTCCDNRDSVDNFVLHMNEEAVLRLYYYLTHKTTVSDYDEETKWLTDQMQIHAKITAREMAQFRADLCFTIAQDTSSQQGKLENWEPAPWDR